MSIQPSCRLCVPDLGVLENLTAELGETWVICKELSACVHMVMVVVIFTVIVKPGLNTLGKVFSMGNCRVLSLP
jgi:hypothetical protein